MTNFAKKTISYAATTSLFGIGLSIGLATSANAAAIISNGTIQLGVDTLGQLNVPGVSPSPVQGTSFVGLRYLPTGNEATSHGCLCEGWGVADALLGVSGFANNALGIGGLTLESFISDATKATSVVNAGGIFRVTHDFLPSIVNELYEVKVTIENLSIDTLADIRYRRTFDWDIEPTTFSEFVTIGGTATASNVLLATNNGFASSNPLVSPGSIGGATGDFTDVGPFDHGANFDFGFGSLAAGASKTFSIFYGGAATETDAFAALAAVGAEVYSFGQASNDPDGLGLASSGNPTNTFIFAFKGVGGISIGDPDPKTTPEPASLLGLLAVGALGASSTLKRKQKQLAE
jgi:hypothetical protein